MTGGFIAVHCGAGHHNEKLHVRYNKLSKAACRAATKILREGGTALEAVKVAIRVLENDPLTNAGFGSNLTTSGQVETDASVMDGKSLLYGGCGAVRELKNPIELAYDICVKQSNHLPLGLIPPCLLVGEGATNYAKLIGLNVVSNKALISPKAIRQYKKYKKLLGEESQIKIKRMDTVGAVCVDNSGHVAAACSSGGLLMKRPGRVGQAALYASGVWADSLNYQNEAAVAVSTSGCGEHLIQTQLAKEIAVDLKDSTCPTTDLYKSMTDKFLKSKHLRNTSQILGGALVLHICKSGESALLWGHSTESMSVGYMKTSDKKPKAMISKLPKEILPGMTINVSGTYFDVTEEV